MATGGDSLFSIHSSIEMQAKQAAALPRYVQLGYSYADLGVNVVETIARLYLLIFYTNVVGLRAGLAGLAVALGLIWDAVTDPMMGSISDRLRHRFGGRRFFVLLGSFLLAAGLVLIFSPPTFETQGARFVWLLGTYVFLNTGLTVMAIPHTAMSGELSADPHVRAVLFGWRFAFANIGAVLAAWLPVQLSNGSSNSAGGIDALPQVAWITGGLIVLGGISVWFCTRGQVPTSALSTKRVRFRALFAPLKNPTFRPLVLSYVIAMLGVGVNAAVALYYYGQTLQLSDSQIQTLLVTFLGTFTVALAVWVRLSRSFGKLKPLTFGASASGFSISLLYLFLPPGNFVLPLILGGVGIGALVGCIVLIDALLTDVIDYDEYRSGEPRAGLYFGCWRFAAKLARAASLLTTGLVLESVGFQADQASDPELRTALRLLFGPGVGLFFLGSGLILLRYRFDDRKQHQVRRILARRRDRSTAQKKHSAA